MAIYICSSSGGAHEKWRTGWNSLSLSPKLVEKLVWVIVISLCKIFVPSYTISGKTGLFLPPNRRTLCWLYLILPNWRDLTKSWGMMLMVSTTNQKCWSQLPTRHVCKCFEGHWPCVQLSTMSINVLKVTNPHKCSSFPLRFFLGLLFF